MSAADTPPATLPPKPGAITPAEALARIARHARALAPEPVPIAAASGRWLAADACAAFALPMETNSAMDGYAVRAADGPQAAAEVVGESRAGRPFTGHLAPGTVIRISTGAPLPPELDSVIPVERAGAADAAGRVALPATERGRHVRHAGEDVGAGDVLAPAGTRLAPSHLVGLAAAGVAELSCCAVPRVAIVVTGDEVIAPGTRPGPGQVIDVHGVALPPLVEAAGGRVTQVLHVRDDPAQLRLALAGLERCDIVIVTGGVSVGRHDHTRAVLAELGVELVVERLLMRPGQPTAIGVSDHGARLWFGLPGNPVSAFVVATLLVQPALRRLAGAPELAAAAQRLPLAQPVTPDPRRWLALRATLVPGEAGVAAVVLDGQASHMMGALAASQALAMVPPGDAPLPAGTQVAVEPLPGCGQWPR